MENTHKRIVELEEKMRTTTNQDDIFNIQGELVDNYKSLVDLIFTDYLILKTEQDKRKNYTKSYYQKNKDKIKKVSLEHYYNKKE
jgi:hypothetical protein